jgi:hypothetical protein
MLTARQFAAAREVNWLNEKLLIGAEKEALAYDGFMWRIPEDAETHEVKPGPKPKPTKQAAAKKGAK